MNNLEILEFRQSLISYINHIQLPIMVKEMVLKDIYNEIQQLSVQEVSREIEEKQRVEREAQAEKEKQLQNATEATPREEV